MSTIHTLRAILESFSLDLHVALPGRVRSYDSSNQTAEIELGLQRVLSAPEPDEDPDTTESLPILPNVPVIWPSCNGFFLHFPLSEGDTVQVVFNELDLNAWREGDGGPVDPGVALRHALSGAVAYPGLRTRGNPNGDADGTHGRVGRAGGPYVEFQPSEIHVGGSEQLVTAAELQAHLIAIDAAIDVVAAAAGTASPYNHTVTLGTNDYRTTTTKGS